MTREEAKKTLEEDLSKVSQFSPMLASAYEMAISALSENKGDLISRQAVEEINSGISKIHELFDIAYEYNKEDSTRTELSQKCTTYLLDVWQTLGAIVDNFPSVENKGEWIPTIERLPEIGDTVLCSVKTHESDHRIIICKYCAEEFWKDGRITAWQPLPEPYKKGE